MGRGGEHVKFFPILLVSIGFFSLHTTSSDLSGNDANLAIDESLRLGLLTATTPKSSAAWVILRQSY